MSLKAKIEAVIYASEEPVTLAQLLGLLGQEAQAELDARDADQASLALEGEADDPDALNAETLRAPETDEDATASEAPAAEGETPAAGAETPAAEGEAPAAETQAPAAEAETPAAGAEAAEAEAASQQEDLKAAAAHAKARERRLRAFFREVVDVLIADYANGDRGLEVREVAGGFRLATKPEYHDAVRGFVKQLKPPLKLSLQALETLAVVAYKQPVTAPEISEIRGVDSGGVLGSLLTRKLIQTAGRKPVIGRPMLYKTSKEFLVRFGLRDINELPSIEEFEKMAGELNDALQEEIPMEDAREDLPEESAEESSALDELQEPPAVDQPALQNADDASEADEVIDEAQAAAVEPNADVHAAQADGVPEETDRDEPGY